MKRIYNPSLDEIEQLCIRPTQDDREIKNMVERVFQDVERYGLRAIKRYATKFDGCSDVAVLTKFEILQTSRSIDVTIKKAIDVAYSRIYAFQKKSVQTNLERVTEDGITCWIEQRAIDKVGLYVPRNLVSSVLMLGVPAQLAGSKDVALYTPPNCDALSAICYAATLCKIEKIVLLGGAQAIAAMTFGTDLTPRVNKILGPGNSYVNYAKILAQNKGIAIDMPAGPSEVMVLADGSAIPSFVASDLLSQAEHGPDSQVMLVTTSELVADTVQEEIQIQTENLMRKENINKTLINSAVVVVESMHAAIMIANEYAPEHIILSVENPEEVASKIQNAGSVFLGNYSPESAGDYASGTNHTLPTGGLAKVYSGVSVSSFQKTISFQSLTRGGLDVIGKTIETLAEVEGLDAHANAVRRRMQVEEQNEV